MQGSTSEDHEGKARRERKSEREARTRMQHMKSESQDGRRRKSMQDKKGDSQDGKARKSMQGSKSGGGEREERRRVRMQSGNQDSKRMRMQDSAGQCCGKEQVSRATELLLCLGARGGKEIRDGLGGGVRVEGPNGHLACAVPKLDPHGAWGSFLSEYQRAGKREERERHRRERAYR